MRLLGVEASAAAGARVTMAKVTRASAILFILFRFFMIKRSGLHQ